MRDSVSFASCRSAGSAISAGTKNNADSDDAASVSILKGINAPSVRSSRPSSIYSKSAMVSSEHAEKQSIQSKNTTKSTASNDERDDARHVSRGAAADKRDGDHDVFVDKAIPSSVRTGKRSKAGASVSSDKPSISSKKPETSKISSASVSKSSKSNKAMLPSATNPVSFEFWTGLSVRVIVAVLQAGGSREIAQKASGVVLAIGKNHEGRQHDTKTMIALSTKLSSIILDAGGSAEVAAAASLAVMKSAEHNNNIHANGSGSLSGSFRSLRKGKSNAKSNKPETPSVALSLNSMQKQLEAKDIETEQKLKTFEDEKLRHRQWEKEVKERVEARRGKEKVELEAQQEILMALEKQNELMRRRLEEKQSELKQREEDRMKKSEEERRQKEKEFAEMSTYFAERKRDLMERINAINMREDDGLQKEKDKSKGFIRNFLENHNLQSISSEAMDLYSINDEAMEITHSLSDEDIDAIMMGREMAEKPGMLHMQNNIIEGSEFMNTVDEYGDPHTETCSGRDKKSDDRGAGPVSAGQDAELVSFARSSFLNKTMNSGYKEKSNSDEKKRQSVYEKIFTNSLAAAADLVDLVTDFDYEKMALEVAARSQLMLSKEADSSAFRETFFSSEEGHSQLPFEDGTDESVTRKPKRGVAERLKSAFRKKEDFRQPPSPSRSMVSFDPYVSFRNKQKMQNRGPSNQKLTIQSVSPSRQRLSRSQQMTPSATAEKQEMREMKRGGSKSFFWKKKKKLLEEGDRKKKKGGFTKRLKSPEGSSTLSREELSSTYQSQTTCTGSSTYQSQTTCTGDASTIHDSWSKH